MKGGTWRISPLALVVAVVVAAAAVLGGVLAMHSVNSQNEALLKDEAAQAAEYVSSVASELSSTLENLAPAVSASNASPLAFETQAQPFAHGPVTLLLAHKTGPGYVVSAAAGPAFKTGQVLDAQLSSALGAADSNITPGPVNFNGTGTTLGFALGPPLLPAGFAIYEQLTIDPFLAITATQAAPFQVLYAAVYASQQPKPSALILANTHLLPLRGTTTETPVSVGSGRWWMIASARSPLAGGFPNAAPLVVVGFGLLLAIAIGSTVEVIVRRHRYATSLVAERTAELLASQEALVLSERLSAIGRMTTVIGHELRNPLGAVLNSLYMIRRTLGEPEAAEPHLVVAERQTARAVSLAQDLTSYMREREPSREPLDLKEVLTDVLEVVAKPSNVVVDDQVPSLRLEADAQQLSQILTNLVNNAFQAMPDGGTLSLRALQSGASAVLTVQDSGEGVEREMLERIFEPFVTTKTDGTGLGLAIVRRLVEAHGGRVAIANGPAGGVVVTVSLPIAMP